MLVAIAVILFVAIPFLLKLWAIRVSRSAAAGRFARALKYLLPGLFLLSILVAIATGTVEVLWLRDASSRATIMADGISTALNCGAFFFLATDVSALVVLGAISLRVRRAPSERGGK